MVLGGFVGGFGWFWVVPCFSNYAFHVVERTRTSSKCQKMKYARAKRAKILFFIVKYANV